MGLDGSVGVVTGAGSGIGKAIAIALAKSGARVVIADLSEPAGQAAVRAVEAIGGKAMLQRTDVSRREEAKQLIETTVDQFDRVDILVNNAGLQHVAPIQDFPEEKWDLLIGVMLTGAFLLSKYAFAHMMRQGFGRIINIASVVAEMGNAGQANYVAAKAGLIGLTKAIAMEMASRNITVNAVAPGFIETPMTDVLSDNVKQDLRARIPLGRMGCPRDVAAAIVFLASDEAGYITGHVLDVNGGIYLA